MRIATIESRLPDERERWSVNHVPPAEVRWLIAELREARKDSERLDWLESRGGYVTNFNTVPGWEAGHRDENGEHYGDTARQALDAARSSSLSSEPRNG